jgi:phage baseplate assembly protein W
MYRTEFDESDWEQAKLERYLATHSRLTREEYDAAVKLATVDAAVDKALKLEARKSMPSKSRPAIQGWDPRLLLHRRMRE